MEKIKQINNFLEELDKLLHKYNYMKDKDVAQLENIIIIKFYDKLEIKKELLEGK